MKRLTRQKKKFFIPQKRCVVTNEVAKKLKQKFIPQK